MIFETVQEWSQCREALLPAIDMTGGTHTEDDVLGAIITGSMKLWRKGRSSGQYLALTFEVCGSIR